jgi:predicted nucleotidyltransferase component of viral defense system
MIGWLQNLDENARSVSLSQASLNSGITPKAIEKDWWVTLVLRMLFTSKYAPYFAFKGGTSLSKGWGIIDRFSEDIDIALNSVAFGMPYKEKPSKTYIEQLRRKGCQFTSKEITAELQSQFEKLQIPVDLFSIEVEEIRMDMPDTDPQKIYVNYKSLFEPNPYLPDRVKVEFSVRSQKDPKENRVMQTLLNNFFPNDLYGEDSFEVTTINPSRTFIEKILLLHEAYNREDERMQRTYRMSRHYYDLYRINKEYSNTLTDIPFIEDIIAHRKLYSRLRHFDYSKFCIGQISIIPKETILLKLKSDYDEMAKEMMYGAVPTFSEVVNVVKAIQDAFNQKSIHPINFRIK